MSAEDRPHTECADYNERMVRLFAAEADEWSGTDEREELLELLRRDPKARAVYIEQAILHSLLLQKGRQGDGLPLSLLEIVSSPVPSARSSAGSPGLLAGTWQGASGYLSQHPMVLSYLVATVCFAVALGLSSLIYVSGDYDLPGAETVAKNSRGLTAAGGRTEETPSAGLEVVGQITGTADCRWTPAQIGPVRREVGLGQAYALTSGLMEITYDTGAKVILQGPCTYEVESANGGFLSLGKLTARVETQEEGGRGKAEASNAGAAVELPHQPGAEKSPFPLPPSAFVVRTPTAVVTDLGTEFGVEVSKEGNTTSHVFRGMVEVQWGGGDVSNRVIRLKASESASVAVDANQTRTLVRKPAQPEAFARCMPGPLPNRLVSYWSFNEAAGTTAHNGGLAGTKFDGTLLSASKTGPGALPRWVPGKFGTALEFSGRIVGAVGGPPAAWSLNYVNVPGGGGLQFANNTTVSLWVKWNGPQPAAMAAGDCATNRLYGCVLGRQRGGRESNAIGLNYNGDPRSCRGLRLKPYCALRAQLDGWGGDWLDANHAWNDWAANDSPADDAASYAMGAAPPGDGTWVHVVLAVDGTSYTIYMNGELLRELPKLPPLGECGPLTIGAWFAAGDVYGPSNATVDDVGIFEWTLSAAQARAIYTTPQVAGLEDYDLGKMNILLGINDSPRPDASAAIGRLVWRKAAHLTGHRAGDAWRAGGNYYVQLDPSGSGVAAETEN